MGALTKAINNSWKIYRKNLLIDVLASVMYFFLIFMIVMIPIMGLVAPQLITLSIESKGKLGLGAVLSRLEVALAVTLIVYLLFVPPLHYGFLYFLYRQRNKEPEVENIFIGFKKFYVRSILVSIIIGAIMFAVFVIPLIYLLLYVAPSGNFLAILSYLIVMIIVALLVFTFFVLAPSAVVVDDKGVIDALKASISIARKKYIPTFAVLLLLSGLGAFNSILGALHPILPLIIGVFVFPFINLVLIEYYIAAKRGRK